MAQINIQTFPIHVIAPFNHNVIANVARTDNVFCIIEYNHSE